MRDKMQEKPLNCLTCPFRSDRRFCNVSLSSLHAYANVGVNLKLDKDVVLFREMDCADRAIVLCAGTIIMSCTSSSGKTVILRVAHSGDVVGLDAVLSRSSYDCTAATAQPSFVKVVRRQELEELLGNNGEFGLHAARSLAMSAGVAVSMVRRLTLAGSVAGQLASLLLQWSDEHAGPGDRFSMMFTHEEVAAMLGTSRETITRTLRRFQDESLIRISGYSVSILSRERLSALHSL